MRALRLLLLLPIVTLAPACGGGGGASDAGADAGPGTDAEIDAGAVDAGAVDAGAVDAGPVDAGAIDAASDAGPRCEGPVGMRFSAGDACNFCWCEADGTTSCTHRVCHTSIGGCTYAGTPHAYGERFASSDGCNECVCAASGLACTVRAGCTDVPESAILLESANDACGSDPTFTPAHVLATLPASDFAAPFLYERARASYPERLPDSVVRVRIVYDGGFMVCRLPSPSQPALDLQVTLEWITTDGAFDEGFPAYLRRNGFGFVDAWDVLASAPLGGLAGSYVPNCAIDPGGYTFAAQLEPSGHATGSVSRVCETDLSFTVGAFDRPAP